MQPTGGSSDHMQPNPLYILLPETLDQSQREFVKILSAWAGLYQHAPQLVIPDAAGWDSDAGAPAIESSGEDFISALIAGRMEGVDRAVLLSSPEMLSGKLAQYGDALVVDLRQSLEGHTENLLAAMDRVTPDISHDRISARVTLITSIFRAADYMAGFLQNITLLEDYESFCHHLFLFTNLSDIERAVLLKHFDNTRNAAFIWHREDPGLYECWNIGVRLSETDYVSNANVDDLRHPRQVKALTAALDNTEGAAIAAAALLPFENYQPDYKIIPTDNPWYAHQAGKFHLSDLGFLKEENGHRSIEPHCIPHCMPVWRRDTHETCGYFDESTYGPYADWAYWMEVLRHDYCGVLIKEPFSYYFVNPGSHNRRGDKLQAFHETVEREFIDDFVADLEKRRAASISSTGYARKLNLLGREQGFGEHRNPFNKLIQALEPLDAGPEGIDFLPFIERTFVWGDDPGEAASQNPHPRTRPWVGVLHVPFGAPQWFLPDVSPERIFETDMWQKSMPMCRGIICLSKDLEQDVKTWYPDIPALTVFHPTELDVRKFDPSRYIAHPRLVQVGDWLRKLQAIFRLEAPQHEKIMLLKNDTYSYLEKDIALFGDARNDNVDLRYMVSNEDYDELLSSSVVLCLLYGTAANNVVIECMARATPIVVNPLPGIVEYLGRGYPLYAETEREAAHLIADAGTVCAAHEYLLERAPQAKIGYEDFLHGIGDSDFYKAL